MFGSIEYRERQMALHRKMRQQAKERQSVLIASGQQTNVEPVYIKHPLLDYVIT